ncbi:hypothetical protein EZS27_009657 [termite gut metagenome]|uniref:Helix-turn-helix domain-containing protein n=1 Tax=termite gut metagenome TaxID=433724 RepID=A0A5J4S904_9ZZZZ
MRYNIESVINRLQEAKKNGKEYLSEKELLSVASPQINNIDEVIELINKAIKKVLDEYSEKHKTGLSRLREDSAFANMTDRELILMFFRNPTIVNMKEAEELTTISRQTLYRWKKEGIVYRDCYIDINLERLRDVLMRIKQIKL